MIALDTHLRRARDVRFRHIPPETLLVRQSGPEVMVLNGIAGRVLDLLVPGARAGDLVATLQHEFDGAAEEIERDTLSFLAELVAAGVAEVDGDG